MNYKSLMYLMLVAWMFAAVACSPGAKKEKPQGLSLVWELKQNLANSSDESLSLLTITNNLGQELPATGWTLYYNYILPVRVDSISGFESVHINGDLRALKPKGFKALAAGESAGVELLAAGSIIQFTDAPDGFYLVLDAEPAKAILCKTEHKPLPVNTLKRNPDDILPVQSAELRFAENETLHQLSANEMAPFIPQPLKYTYADGTCILGETVSISFPKEFAAEAAFLKEALAAHYEGIIELKQDAADAQISFINDASQAEEGYVLEIAGNKICVSAAKTAGAFYGLQSLLQLIPAQQWGQPKATLAFGNISVSDAPRFPYRGIFLDVARNFHTKESVLALLDKMAMYKLNKFHFHVCDDEGWRIEIPGLPELTTYGSLRGHSVNEENCLYPSFASGPVADEKVSHGCGHYSRADFVEIVRYATQRHIEVIPEVDMPGHARAAIRSMQKRYDHFLAQGDSVKALEYLLQHPDDKSVYQSVQGWTDNVIDVAMPSSYRFIEKVVDELSLMFTEAGTNLKTVHTGGDEIPQGVWDNSPACLKFRAENPQYGSYHELFGYFVERFSALLEKRNMKAAGWEEVGLTQNDGEEGPNKRLVGRNIVPYIWNNMWGWGAEDRAYQLANAGYPVVLAHVTNFYFDLAYNKDPQERGYYWGGYIDTRKPWEYTPLDITLCAESDRFGHVFERADLQKKVQALTPAGAKNILGMQGLLWAENSLGGEVMEYQYFPKMLGLAERAWSAQPEWATIQQLEARVSAREKAWNEFVNRVGRNDLPRFDRMGSGVNYRVPLPGAVIKEGKLHANVRFPALVLRYTTDGSEPTATSPEWKEPVTVQGKVKIAAFTTNGRMSRVVEL